ncbi:UNVERIFIED_CONTAM: protein DETOXIFICATION 30 [Sesamum radiatum]|uniref:Protein DETOXIFICATION 30 n=1 Tax=Sesamum radiatum TaxID=300843 RepID=A0AAW2S042_SESRA
MAEKFKEPLLEHTEDEDHAPGGQFLSNHSFFSSAKHLSQYLSNHSFFSSFVVGQDDIPPIAGVRGFYSAFKAESSKLWFLAGPAILTSIFQYSLGAITQTFAGHVGTLDLAAFSVENSVISGLCFGVMVWYLFFKIVLNIKYVSIGLTILTMGQLVRATFDLFWICTVPTDGNGKCTGDPLRAGVRRRADRHARRLHAAIVGYSPGHQFSVNVYVHIRGTNTAATRPDGGHIPDSREICAVDGPSALRLRVELSDRQVLASSERHNGDGLDFRGGAGLHVLFSWLLMLKLGWGMAGGAVVLNISWWFLVAAQLIYVFSGPVRNPGRGFPGRHSRTSGVL